ncbi:hypothetical protein QE152_g12631 [Popillia japonica]|uniref:Uncharacterized protein n=1 Tax=Popillia japonica TaxID=7064 RepID=A0AAW1LJ26_POPJA
MPRSRTCSSRVHKRSGRSKIMKNLVKKQSQLSPEKDREKNDMDLDLPPLEMEGDEEYKPLGDLMGRRIVDLAHLLTEYEKVWQMLFFDETEKAGVEERKIAMKKGDREEHQQRTKRALSKEKEKYEKEKTILGAPSYQTTFRKGPIL